MNRTPLAKLRYRRRLLDRAIAILQKYQAAFSVEQLSKRSATQAHLLQGECPATLSSRQREIAALLAQGLTNRRIAAQLGIAEQTVKNHIHSAFLKLGIRKRGQLAVVGRKNSLFVAEPAHSRELSQENAS
jgi:DNA-binding NarL/FixJ family response regulator